MNPQNLAKAVVHWLAYERLCNRGHLLSEAMLTVPVGQFLNSTQTRRVDAERSYPNQPVQRGRPKQIDFVLVRRGQGTVAHLIETKWITVDRVFKQEIINDLLRLETCQFYDEEGRWLVVAGQTNHVRASIQETRINTGGGTALLFEDILSFDETQPRLNVRVGDAVAAHRKLWATAAAEMQQPDLPLSITTKLASIATSGRLDSDFQCVVWQIQSVSKRATCPR